jgi:hypothetical protein
MRSTCLMVGSSMSSPMFSINAAATCPERCAWRPESSGKVSKIPKVVGPRRIAYHVIVSGSSLTRSSPLAGTDRPRTPCLATPLCEPVALR